MKKRIVKLCRSVPCLFLASAILSGSVLAQTSPASKDGKKLFTPDFFTAYTPVTALDMIDRLPGFSLNSGDDRRGFGDNAGNVLIDGERPSTKSDDVRTILGRIPASQVERIELTEQAGGAADARGKAQVANVVRKAGNKLSGTYEAVLEVGERGVLTPFGNASVSVRRGPTTYDLSARHFGQFNREQGPELVRTGLGALIERREQFSRSNFQESSVTAAVKSSAGGVKFNVNGKVNFDWFRQRRLTDFFNAADQLTGDEILRIKDADLKTQYEIGGDIEFALSSTLKSKLIALYREEKSTNGQSNITRRGPAVDQSITNGRGEPTEYILRSQNDWKVSSAHSVQFGVEGAINKLAAQFSGSSNRNGVITQFPASDVRVKEWRIEPFVSDVWTINPALKLEAGLVAEKSRITVSGGTGDQREFLFWKPRAVATWTMDNATNFELRAERQVAQLNFFDFVSSVDLGAFRVDAGNAQLVPEKTWTFEGVVRRKFWERGSVELKASYVFVTDTQDLIPIRERDSNGTIISQFDGPGNIGASKRWNLEAEVKLPLDKFTAPLGVTGMELKWVGHYHGSRVTDPVTGLSRGRSNNPQAHHDFNFRHDIAGKAISYGVDVSLQAANIAYFLDSTDTFSRGAEFFVWAEYKKWKYGTLRFQVGNPFDVNLKRSRVFFRDTRASNDVITRIDRQRSRDMRFRLSLSGKF